ncbi:MAG: hypothetical protein ACYC96_05960 [Fimbriimonadaceae bacterium]
MLQTRLYPYFQGEERRIKFAAAPAYLWLVRVCVVGGIVGAVAGFLSPIVGIELPLYPAWWVLVGSLVASAGIIAALSLPSISFNVRERVYRRWDGIASLGRQTGGRFDLLDALVVTAHQNLTASVMSGGLGVEFRLTLHWKGAMQPPLLLALDHRSVPGGAPLSVSAGPMLQLAHRVSTALAVQLYDNSAGLSR